jgi:uncharacterized cupredoxin-like copper-binding protein
MKLRIAAVLALLAAVTAGLVAFAGSAGASPASPQVVAPLKVTVTMSDFKFRLSVKSVPKNRPIVFTVVNKGPTPHDWDVAGTKGTPIIAAGKRVTQKVTFKKAGKFRYVCTVPRHAQFGMAGNLTVK